MNLIQVIVYHMGSNPCLDLIELRCVCVCVLAILRKEADVDKQNDDVCKVSQECENTSENVSVNKLWECLRYRNIDGLEEAVKGLNTKSENTENVLEDQDTQDKKDEIICNSEIK
ncbi:hypothetical protein RF11_16479 [Thelohanellus kitauei]|uniref:Uncharacterized protein n=1 Tax=Thelohanellus kitauei TaxID=669202 RepID=A0A0C2NI34_THEKT|nr:hypothetical protein RF11_16479 [Thelohanellus kitauei]